MIKEPLLSLTNHPPPPPCHPRMGLYQMESLRQDVLNLIKKSNVPKWQIIGTMMCCLLPTREDQDEEAALQTCQPLRNNRRFTHPMDSRVGLTTHTPLFPPGKIIHVVRSHPKNIRSVTLSLRVCLWRCRSTVGRTPVMKTLTLSVLGSLVLCVIYL